MINEKGATHVVIHPFDGAVSYRNGDRVNALGWKNTDKLVGSKFLRPLSPSELRAPTVDTSTPAPAKRTVVLKKLVVKK